DDWGGVSPVTPDHVNPERPWPHLDDLASATGATGLRLRERLTAHPRFVLGSLRADQPWIDPRLHPHVRALVDPITGLADEEARPEGMPWQEPDGGLDAEGAGTGRTALHHEVDTVGRTGDRRGDFDDVYGDWDEIAARVGVDRRSGQRASGSPERLDVDVAAALRQAADDPAGLGDDQYLALMLADGADLDAVTALADDVRQDVIGDDVTYVVNRNINFTNVCYVGCRFCAFAQRKSDADAYTLSLEQVA